MSLSSISALAGQASTVYGALTQLFGGAGSVTLGDFSFDSFEVPETIRWGGKQHIVSQTMPGGTNVFAAMGIEFPPLSWSGIFDGMNALSRSRQLYTMLNAAALITLSWNDRTYTVMVSDYEASDTKTNWIPYRISCLVLRDETLSSNPPAPSLLSQVTADIAGAIGVTPAQLTQGVGTALSAAQAAATVAGAVTAGSSAALALTGAVATAATAVNAATVLANSQIATLASAAASTGSAVLPAGNALTGAANLIGAMATSANLAALPIIGGLVGRIQINMANAST